MAGRTTSMLRLNLLLYLKKPFRLPPDRGIVFITFKKAIRLVFRGASTFFLPFSYTIIKSPRPLGLSLGSWAAFVIPAAVAGVIYLILSTPASAAVGVNKQINFQGKVVNSSGTNVTDGTYDFVFKIYPSPASGAVASFTESWTSAALFSSTMTSAPSSGGESATYSSNTNESTLKVGQILTNTTKNESVIITSVDTGTNVLGISPTRQAWDTSDTITNKIYVRDGIFRVVINSLNQDLSGVDFNSDSLYVGVNFNADGEMKPRMRFTAAPYALNADQVNGLSVTNVSGDLTAGPNADGSLTITTNGNGNGLNLNTAAGASGNSGAITIQSGNTATSGNSGNVSIDVGAGASANGTISIGTTNASGLTIGRAGVTTNMAGLINHTSTQTSGTIYAMADSTALTAAVIGQQISLTGNNDSNYDKTGLKIVISDNDTGNKYALVANDGTNDNATLTVGGVLTLGKASTTQGSLILGNTSANLVTIKSSNSTSAATTFVLPVDDGTDNQCLKTDGGGATATLSWEDCSTSSGSITDNGSSLLYPATGKEAYDLLIGGNTLPTAGSSTSTLWMDVSAGMLYLGNVDTTAGAGDTGINGGITFYSNADGNTETAPYITTDSNGNLILSAPTGTVDIGTTSGDIEMSLLTVNDNFIGDKTVTLTGAYSQDDFTFKRILTSDAAGETQAGSVVYITDIGDGTSTTVNGDLLKINSALTAGTFTGNLMNLQLGGSSKFTVNSAGQLTVTDTSTTASGKSINITKSGAVSGSSYGLYSAVSGASTTNIGGYFTSSGATNNYGLQISGVSASANNYAVYSDAAAQSYFAGNIGVGDASPDALLDIDTTNTSGTLVGFAFPSGVSQGGDYLGLNLNLSTNLTSAADADITGVSMQLPALTSSGSTTTNYYGYRISAAGALDTSAAGSNTTNVNWYGLNIQLPNIDTGEATDTTSSYGIYITGGTITDGAGVENEYGIYQATSTSKNYFAGTMGLGDDATPDGYLEIEESTAALTSDLEKLTVSGSGAAEATGVDGLQIDFATAGTTASADNAGLRIDVTSNNSGSATTLAGIYVGNLASAEANSTERAIRIGTGWDVGILVESGGITIDGGTFQLTNSARHSKTVVISPEYQGAIFTAYYGAGTDSNITGSLTSDAETAVASEFRTYYQWERTTDATLHYYTVAVRVTLPSDFSDWQTSNAVQVEYVTDTTGTTANVLDVRVYLENNATQVTSGSTTGLASGTADTWTSLNIDDVDNGLDDDTGQDWDTAGQTAIIYLRMGSASSEHVRIGDIRLNYLGKY